jgi:hypothetical protein
MSFFGRVRTQGIDSNHGSFRHLSDRDLDEIQRMVDEDWELLLRKA